MHQSINYFLTFANVLGRRTNFAQQSVLRRTGLMIVGLALGLALLLALTPSTTYAQSPCGGEGQRACCVTERPFGPSCNAGLVEITAQGCTTGNCTCGGFNPTNAESAGMCRAVSTCGGKGQRACCVAERIPSCDAGLVEVPGCSGDCTCGGINPTGDILSSGMCTVLEDIDEPGTAWTPAPSTPANPLRGYADLHLHLFGDLAHGGGVIAGQPYNATGGVNAALQDDYRTDLDLVNADGSDRPADSDGEVLFHGDHVPIVDDPVGTTLGDTASSQYGAPVFSSWPQWSSATHQQAYYKWVERSWRGGLRLVVMLAVNNEAMCKGNKRLRGTVCENTMAPIDVQLDEAYKFQDFIDTQAGGTGQGWFRIVTTPQQARDVISQGKLAVVLGIEVDNLFNCKYPGAPNQVLEKECDIAHIKEQVDHYYARGVRHIFPIHNFDNAFGGSASWQDSINVGNRYSEGHYWDVENCPEPGGKQYGFKLDPGFAETFISIFSFGVEPPDATKYANYTTTCNLRGLTNLGETLIEILMDKGMVIDIDHMSNKSLNRTLELAEARNYPLVASHVLMFDLHNQDVRHERMRTREDLERLSKLGGLIGLMLKDDVLDSNPDVPFDGLRGQKVTTAFGSKVADDCRHSSKMWAQMYQYATDVMTTPIAFGSDFNGFAGHLMPRFGSDACGGNMVERWAQGQSRLTYPFILDGFGTFDKQVTGDKTFDYNVDGLAHIGLLPDLIADLKAVGLTDEDLEPLWQSAEAYVEVWEQVAVDGSNGAGGGVYLPLILK